jgi:hypothetical protein
MNVPKVLVNDKIDSRVLKKTFPYMQQLFEIVVLNKDDETDLLKALNQTKPSILFIKEENWSNAIKAYKNMNNCKVVMFADKILDNVDYTVTNNISLAGTPNVHLDLVLADLQVINFLDKTIEKTDVSIFINEDTDIETYMIDFLCKNYNVKIYGNKKINSPKYLGIPSDMEKIEILNQSKVVIDFGTYDYMNAILLGCYPMVYTNTEVPLDFTPFSNLVSLDEAMSYITDDSNAEDIKNKLASLYGHFLQRDNYLSGLTDIFNTLGYTKETQTLFEIKGDIINDRIANR